MPVLFRRPRLIDPRIVPTCPVEVDWSHPLAAGLVACYAPGSIGGFRDIAGIAPPLTPGPNASIVTTSIGPSLASVTAGSGATSGPIPDALRLVTGGTISWIGAFAGGTQFTDLFGVDYNDQNSAPYVTYNISAEGAGNQIGFTYNAAGSQLVLETSRPPSGQTSIIFPFTVGGGISLYYGGNLSQSWAWSGGAPNYTTSSRVNLGWSGGGTYSGATTTLALIHNTPLPAALVAWLSAEPFAMLRPIARRTYAFLSGGGSWSVASADTAVSSDLAGAIAAFVAARADTAAASDTAGAVAALSAAASDTAAASTSTGCAAAMLAARADTAAATDGASATAGMLAVAADVSASADALANAASMLASAADAVAAADLAVGAYSEAGGATYAVAAADIASASDTLAAALAVLASAQDAVAASDAAGVRAAMFAATADVATASDAVAVAGALVAGRYVLRLPADTYALRLPADTFAITLQG